MSKAPSRGAHYFVRNLKGSSRSSPVVHHHQVGVAASAVGSSRAFGNGARLVFQEQATVLPSPNGTVLEWTPPPSIGPTSAENSYHHHPGRGHRANYRHSGPSTGTATVLPSFWIQPAASSSSTNALLFGTSSVSPAGPSTHASLPASLAAPQPSSYSATSLPRSHRLSDPSVRIPSNKASTSGSQLTLHHGAFGIPKRPKVSAKGKEKQIDPADPLYRQLHDLQEQILSVQVGEVRFPPPAFHVTTTGESDH